MNAIDTNMLVYAVDTAEPEKSRQAQELLESLLESGAPLILLWQVAAEFLACLRRWEDQKLIGRSLTEAYLDQFISPLPMAYPTTASLPIALRLSTRYSLSHWDSRLLAACVEAGVDVLYSEDLTAGAVYDSVTVINPFQ
jgi:predicted nucleic acid-binding protein